jgi:cell division protein FtsQ
MSVPVLMGEAGRRPAPRATARPVRDAAPERPLPAGLISAALLLALLLLGALHVMNPATLPIRTVEINGGFVHLSPAALRAVAENVVRGGFFNVNVETVRRAVLREPWVREVTVRRVWPQSLSLMVQEQVAVARWGTDGLLNAEGMLFRPDPSTFPQGLPQLTGPAGTEQLMLERFRFLEQAFAGSGLEVRSLTLSARRAWRLGLATGQEVVLGRTQFVERVRRFVTAARNELAAHIDAVGVADMRYTNGYAVRWEDGAAPVMETGNDGQEN